MAAHAPEPPPFVDVAWVRANPGVVLADVRWQLMGPSGRDAYEQGHIPGAVFVDLDHDGAVGGGDLGILLSAWGICSN